MFVTYVVTHTQTQLSAIATLYGELASKLA